MKIGDIVTVKPHTFRDLNDVERPSNFTGRTGRIISIDIPLPTLGEYPRYALVAFSTLPDDDCNISLQYLRTATGEETEQWRTTLS